MRFITKTVEYNEVYRFHQRISGKYFNLLMHFSESEESIGIGIVVRAKVGKAVVRNKIKRRIKGFLHQNKSLLPNGRKVIILVKNEAAAISWSELCQDLRESFQKMQSNGAEKQ